VAADDRVSLVCLMMPPPATPTLFPYTTLFRSDDARDTVEHEHHDHEHEPEPRLLRLDVVLDPAALRAGLARLLDVIRRRAILVHLLLRSGIAAGSRVRIRAVDTTSRPDGNSRSVRWPTLCECSRACCSRACWSSWEDS